MRINAGFKHKNPKEAADASLILWRKNISLFLLLFAIPLWVAAFAAQIFIPDNLPWLPWILIWLLKPFFDRIILHIISVRFFENNADLKRVCRGLGRSIFRGLAGDLLWRRFSPLRSAMMPVRVLELNLKPGKNISERKKNLEKGGINYCYFLTIWGIFLEAALLLGLFIFYLTMGEFISGGFLSSIEENENIGLLFYAAWCMNYMLVESIYVCMGFNLYINARVGVEGWDIEIKFRDLTKKITDKIKNGALAAIVILFILLPAKSYAEESSGDVPIETLQRILESPDFGGEKDAWGIRFKNTPKAGKTPDFRSDTLQRIFAHSLQVILIIFILCAFVFIFIYIRKYHWKTKGDKEKTAGHIINKKLRDDPKELLEKAKIFNEQGKTRLAWGYCTAAAIQFLSLYHGVLFPPNATENDCAQIINTDNSGDITRFSDDFKKLINHWIYLAYAGINPPNGSFKEAVNFCVLLGSKNE